MSSHEWNPSTERYQQLLSRYQELIGKYERTVVDRSGGIRLGEWLLQNTPDGVALIRGGKMVSCNRRFYTTCALRPEWQCVSHPELPFRGTLQSVLVRAVEWMVAQPRPREVFHVKSTSGEPPLLEVCAHEVEADTHAPHQAALIVRDSSDYERWAQDLMESARRDQFLALLAHELRNPLTPITGAAELLLRSNDDPQVHRAADIILRQARHQARMIEDLLDIARVREGKIQLIREPVDLCVVIGDAVEATEPRREVGPSLEISLPEKSTWVEGDATRLTQVVSNLLTNAAKFTPSSGQNWLELKSDAGIAWIRIRDTGLGIAPDLLPQIWETFVQDARAAQQAPGGLGLGLALVRSLVEMHGGGVRAFSQGEGHGTEITVWLPLCEPPCVAPHSALLQPQPSRSRRVLIVDDNVDARESIGDLLTALGHETSQAAGIADAVAVALCERPEVILCDLQLAEQDGFAVAAVIRPLLPHATFLAMSGYLSPELEVRAHNAGYQACFCKPLDLERLLSKLNST